MTKKEILEKLIDDLGDCNGALDAIDDCPNCPVSTRCDKWFDDLDTDNKLEPILLAEAQRQLVEIELDKQIDEFLKDE